MTQKVKKNPSKKNLTKKQNHHWIKNMNTQQKIGFGLVVAGIALLPTVHAFKAEYVSPTVIKDVHGNVVEFIDNSQSVSNQSTNNQGFNNQSMNVGNGYIQMNGQTIAIHAPNSSDGSGFVANQNRQYVSSNYVSSNNANHHLASNSSLPSTHCEYYGKAGQAGFYHFKFDEPHANDLVNYEGRHKVHREAIQPLRDMVAAAKADGVTLSVGSAFRSKDYQRGIVNRKTSAGQSLGQIYKVSSHPGFSEHHTGYAVDFSPIDHSFAKSSAYRWLKKHAHEFDFHQTFTPEYSDKTGISQESWHWKYLGTPNAKQALANGNCYLQNKNTWRAVDF